MLHSTHSTKLQTNYITTRIDNVEGFCLCDLFLQFSITLWDYQIMLWRKKRVNWLKSKSDECLIDPSEIPSCLLAMSVGKYWTNKPFLMLHCFLACPFMHV